ncbi:IS6 family transposase [Sphingomonadaceae bacterium jetA1]|jgi:putative transposase|uniref:IS6 family transposase n=1 Tax=Facivitalis istanbulensis TaxID=3075838 RepID=UPI00347068A3
MYVRFPLSLRNVEDLLFERGIDICHETVRLWWNRFGPIFAGDIRRARVSRMRSFRHWRWHLDEMYVKLNGEMVYLWRAVDHEGEVLESYVTRTRDKVAALAFKKKALKRYGSPEAITTDGLRSYGAAMDELGCRDRQEIGWWVSNRVESSHLPCRWGLSEILCGRPLTSSDDEPLAEDDGELGFCLRPLTGWTLPLLSGGVEHEV